MAGLCSGSGFVDISYSLDSGPERKREAACIHKHGNGIRISRLRAGIRHPRLVDFRGFYKLHVAGMVYACGAEDDEIAILNIVKKFVRRVGGVFKLPPPKGRWNSLISDVGF